MKNKLYLIIAVFLFLGFVLTGNANAEEIIGHIEEITVSVYDQDGNYIFATAMGVVKGDRYISEDNVEYVVEAVNGNRAIARRVGKVDLLEGTGKELSALTPLAAEGKKLIGLYFTHNDESYKPGPEVIQGRGEIHNVGQALQSALEEKGIRVVRSDNLHLPHDGAAYERSRATALALLKQRPDAIFDVHRDAVPRKEEYLKTVDGKQISQVRLVVGRQNPNRGVNDGFARQLKAIADKQYPGLIKGIFYGSGSYNQQLSPRALLFEFGTHVTTKEQAQESTRMLADSINLLLYGAGGKNVRARENPSAFSTIAWIVGIVIIGLLAYLFVNEGSWEGVVKRIKNFFGREIIDRGDKE